MKVLAGTMNPGKLQGIKEAFEVFCDDVEVIGYKASSGVSDQPVSGETLEGARNRMRDTIEYAIKEDIDVSYFASIESGIVELYNKWFIMNIALIYDPNGNESIGIGPVLPVPEKYVDEIISTDLGKVMDRVFNEEDLRSGKGGIALLTNNVVSRIDLTKEAFIMALTTFINGDIWKD